MADNFLVPKLPVFYDMPITDDGVNMSVEASLYNDDLWQSLNYLVTLINQFVTYNGLTVPSFTTAEIAVLAVDKPNGTFWYDTTLNKIVAKSNGTVQVVI